MQASAAAANAANCSVNTSPIRAGATSVNSRAGNAALNEKRVSTNSACGPSAPARPSR